MAVSGEGPVTLAVLAFERAIRLTSSAALRRPLLFLEVASHDCVPVVPALRPREAGLPAHEGGKLGVAATQPLRNRDDLSLLYTPGVAEVSRAIAADPSLLARYTARRNTVAVITDGTAVLGRGDIGPLAAMPVMEGKAVLFKHFAGVAAVPVCMETGTVDELVDAIARIAPSYGGST